MAWLVFGGIFVLAFGPTILLHLICYDAET